MLKSMFMALMLGIALGFNQTHTNVGRRLMQPPLVRQDASADLRPARLRRQNASPNLVPPPTRRRRGLSGIQQEMARNFVLASVAYFDAEHCLLGTRQPDCHGHLGHRCLGYSCTANAGSCAGNLVNQIVSVLDMFASIGSLVVPGLQAVRTSAVLARTATTTAAAAIRHQAANLLRRGVKQVGKEMARSIRDTLIQESMLFAADQDNEYAFISAIHAISDDLAARRVEEENRNDVDVMEILGYIDFIGVTGVIEAFQSQSCAVVSPPAPEPSPLGSFIEPRWDACLDYPYQAGGTMQQQSMFQYGCSAFQSAVSDLTVYEPWETPPTSMEQCRDSCNPYLSDSHISRDACLHGCEWMDCTTNWARKRGCMHFGNPDFTYVRSEQPNDMPIMLQTWEDSGSRYSARHLNCLDYPLSAGESTVSFRKGCNQYVEVDKAIVNPRWSYVQRCYDGCDGDADMATCHLGCQYMECSQPWATARGCAQELPEYVSGDAPLTVADPQLARCMAYPYTGQAQYLQQFRLGCDLHRSGYDSCLVNCNNQGYLFDRRTSIEACERGCAYMRCDPSDTWVTHRGCNLASPVYNPMLNEHDMPLAVGVSTAVTGPVDTSATCNGMDWLDVQGGDPSSGSADYYLNYPPDGDRLCPTGCGGEYYKNFVTQCWPNGRKWQRFNWEYWYPSMDACNGPFGDMWNLANPNGRGNRIYLRSVPCANCAGSWSDWSDCDSTGTRRRFYTHTTPAANGGFACPVADGAVETEQCTPPQVDCQGSWGAWAECPACGSGVATQRFFSVVTPASGRGQDCEAEHGQRQQAVCEISTCLPVDCFGVFDVTSTCDVTCGTGSVTRRFRETRPAQHGGLACPAADGTTDSVECQMPACVTAEPTATPTSTPTPPPTRPADCRLVGAFKPYHATDGFTGNFFHAFSSDVGDVGPGSAIVINGEPFTVRYVNTNKIRPGMAPSNANMQAVYLTTHIRDSHVTSFSGDAGRVRHSDCWSPAPGPARRLLTEGPQTDCLWSVSGTPCQPGQDRRQIFGSSVPETCVCE